MTETKEYYSEDEVYDLVEDIEELNEYLNGWVDAIKGTMYKKKYVDMYVNR